MSNEHKNYKIKKNSIGSSFNDFLVEEGLSEAVLKVEAIDLLLKNFGVLETERFITSIKNNNFDYTEWHKNLWKEKSINEIHNMAVEFEKEKYNGVI